MSSDERIREKNEKEKRIQEIRGRSEPEPLKKIQLDLAFKRELTSVANHIVDRLREVPPYEPLTRGVKVNDELHPWDEILVSHNVLDEKNFNYGELTP